MFPSFFLRKRRRRKDRQGQNVAQSERFRVNDGLVLVQGLGQSSWQVQVQPSPWGHIEGPILPPSRAEPEAKSRGTLAEHWVPIGPAGTGVTDVGGIAGVGTDIGGIAGITIPGILGMPLVEALWGTSQRLGRLCPRRFRTFEILPRVAGLAFGSLGTLLANLARTWPKLRQLPNLHCGRGKPQSALPRPARREPVIHWFVPPCTTW